MLRSLHVRVPVADLTTVALEFVRLYGPLALCVFTFLETSMLFPFLPSEVVVPAAAALIVTDLSSFLVFVTAAGVGGTAGAFVPYVVFADPRIGLLDRLRDHVHVSDDRVERGRAWFQRWGESSVCWGRFLPVFRSVVSVPAGVARMNPVRFGLFTGVGTVGFYATTGTLVYYGRQEPVFTAALALAADRPVTVAVGVAALVGAASLLRALVRRRDRGR